MLVGTISVEKSEKLSGILKKMGVRHEVLNAKNHEREASIVAQAGRKGTVTVSTNMAGRGTDILLGGNPEFMTKDACLKEKVAERLSESEAQYVADEHFYYFTHLDQFYRVRRDKWDEIFARFKQQTDLEHDQVVALGGLHIVATERHESRRIDNQLRGRAGRQGDPGSSKFFLSLQDDLLRIFGGERMQNLMLRLGMEEDVPIESQLITKRIAKAQEAVEMQNFEARKHLLEYDDVMNKQRQAVYGMRRQLLEGIDQKERVMEMVQGIVDQFVDMRCPNDKHPDTWDLATLRNDMLSAFGSQDRPGGAGRNNAHRAVRRAYSKQLKQKYQEKEDLVGADVMRQTERIVMLQVIDNQWKDHLLSMDELKQGIGNRAYGQKDPLVEYKKESCDLFTAMMDRIEDETVRYLYFLQVSTGPGRVLPYPEEEEEERGGNGSPAAAAASRAKSSGGPPRRHGGFHAQHRAQEGQGDWRSCSSRRRRVHRSEAGGRGAESRPQRSVPLRQRQEIQEVPRGVGHGAAGRPAGLSDPLACMAEPRSAAGNKFGKEASDVAVNARARGRKGARPRGPSAADSQAVD